MSTSTDTSTTPGTGKRIALVIGVNTAPNSSLPPLNHAVADAEAIAEVLQQHCNFELLVPPLVDEKATSAEVKRAVQRLARNRNDEDFLLLYFSGHGQPMTIESERRDVYLVTHDFNEVEVEEDENAHFSMHWLRDKLYLPTEAGKVLLILDCCYAGDVGRTAPDPYLEELKQRIAYYFEAPGSESGARSGGQRLALTATSHNAQAVEKDGHGLMTGLLLPALRGDVDAVLDIEGQGQVSLQLLHRYLEIAMPSKQRPSLSGDFAGRSCILVSHPERAEQLRRNPSGALGPDRPRSYIPLTRNPLFQPRPGEFESLEHLLFGPGTEQQPRRIGLIGMVGMGGVGKTQLAVELAYRCQQRFPDGVFWVTATGTTTFEWQRHLAELAGITEYLPRNDDVSSPENEARRARHFCRYLAYHADALVILDNVEDPALMMSTLPALAGGEVACTILYTSRKRFAPPGVTIHAVEQLKEEGALRLLLGTTRPSLLAEVLAGSQHAEAKAARTICQGVGYLPLALVHLQGSLARDPHVTLVRLAEVLRARGALEVAKRPYLGAAPLFATFRLSWEQVGDEGVQRLFKLASYFPEATPVPLWLLGLAAGLGESGDIFEPLGEARLQLQELSLLEELSAGQVRLHPLVHEFGRRLVAEDSDKGKTLLKEAREQLTSEFADVNKLERRALHEGYWRCLEQIRAAREYAELLETDQAEQLRRIERWLARESYLLGDGKWWPKPVPGLFYQQFFNRSVEEGYPLPTGEAPTPWLRQAGQVGAEDRSLLRVFAGHAGEVWSVAFSPDGRQVLTGSADRTARLWETGSGKHLATLQGHMGDVTSVAFSPDRKQMLTGSLDQTARLWESANGNLLVTLQGHVEAVTSVAFSPDRKQVLTGSMDQTARLWETASGNLLVTLQGHVDAVTSVAFSPDGKQVLTGSWDQTARLWETASGNLLVTLQDHAGGVESVAFSPDGKQVLTGSEDPEDRTARLWETASGNLLVTLQGHADAVTSVAFSPDGKQVLTGSWDQTVRLWETASGRVLAILQGHVGWVRSVAFSPDGKQVLTGSDDQTARLWETGSGRMLTTLGGHVGWVKSVAFSADGKQVLTGSDDQTARLWEMGSGKNEKLLATLRGHTGIVTSVAFSPDGRQVLTGSDDKTARLWEMGSGRMLATLQGHVDAVTSVAFSPDGTKLLTCSWDKTARLWEVASGKQLATLAGHTSIVESGLFSPDGTKVLTGSSDRTARLWEAASGKQLATLAGHAGGVKSVGFLPGGKRVLTGSSDQTVRLWEAASGKLLATLPGHTGVVTSIVFSPDGRLIMTCDEHGWVLLWWARGADIGSLLGVYVATYEVGAIHWQDNGHVVLADMGGPHFRPHFYRLKLEGM